MRVYRVGSIMSLIVSVCIGSAVARAGSPPRPDGRHLYREYCASCHGLTGKGDGPDAASFASPPRNLHAGFLRKYKTDDLVRRVREGQPLELALDLPALRARATEVEALVAYLKQLPNTDWERAGRGAEVYVDRCVMCHGIYGRPVPTLPPGVRQPRDLSDAAFQREVDDPELITLVRHGRKKMPALTPRVSESDARVLVTFVRLLSPGFELYQRYCVGCHGENGRGPDSLADEISRPAVVFDHAYFAHRDPEQLRSSVWHMVATQKPVMPHYRRLLTDADARAIVEYLKGIKNER